ncbi:MAG TPA: helix-turn-helix domain-containing protein, partial [Thermoanaerobaculia bacterium]|nr:helix-turn-helix domain-containing protein [Thermoanaerobaculia bacterium]
STFLEPPALPPRLLEEVRNGERVARADVVTGTLTLVAEPAREDTAALSILVRENPRLPARAVLLLEEAVQVAGLARCGTVAAERIPEHAPAPSPEPSAAPREQTEAETVLRQTDDLKKIVETVEREVIDRTMRRVEGNQSRGAEVLNISRGSLIAKLKEFGIPDYRYLRRQRKP